ncbi:MAG TPA: 2Fe-2S iron-sulfur cluster-binding protein [Ignavibacteria bacterium]
MPVVIFYPSGKRCLAEFDKSLLDVAFENLVEINHNCAGVCACTSCRVLIKQGYEYLNDISEDEIFMLNTENLNSSGTRLACMCKIIKGDNPEIIVEIPAE